MCLLEDQIEQSLLQELTASDQNSCSDDNDSSGTDDLTVVEVISWECSDSKIDVCNVLLHLVRLLLRMLGIRVRTRVII